MDPYRLPTSIVPSRYDIRLAPDLEAASFDGKETIALDVLEPVEEVVLNAVELQIESAHLENGAGQRWSCEVRMDEATERLHVRPPERLAPGNWQLSLDFRGTLNDRLRGFYRARYADPAGALRTIAATHLESTDARRAFPCWDEPAFKAVFGVTLAIDPELEAVANTRIHSETAENGRRVIRFSDTIRMSSYLVAFAVGQLEISPAKEVGRTPTRVITLPGKEHLIGFAQAISEHALRYFEDYFGVPYPGDKLDHIGLPDFAFGAMENLGLITYRDAALLLDEQASTLGERGYVADVIAHEISHMWFGDLVTMAWWNGIWLNEAFATFMAAKAVDAWKPEWDRWTEFGVSRALALDADGLHHTRPIEFPVESPTDAEAMFDVLTYEKGGSVLRMLEQHIGEQVFRDGVREYLRRHAYSNADTLDLWVALGAVAGQGVPDLMQGWVFQPGFPLIDVRRDPDGLHLRQQRFTYLPPGDRPADAPIPDQRWSVPLQIRLHSAGEAKTVQHLLEGSEATLPAPPDLRWAVANAGGNGFYRVRYSPDLLSELVDHLPELTAVERFGLLDDAWALTQAGLVPIVDFLDLTGRYQGETDRNVWTVLLGGLGSLRNLIDDDLLGPFAGFVRDRLSTAAARLGFQARTSENELTRQLRGEIIQALGTLGESGEIQHWAEKFYSTAADRAAPDPDLWKAALTVRGHFGDERLFEEFFRRYESHPDPQEQRRARGALTAFRPEGLVRSNLERTLDGGYRLQDAPYQVLALLTRPHSRALAWEHLKSRWSEMEGKYPRFAAHRIWEGTVELNRPEWEAEVREVVGRIKLDLGGKLVQQHLERLHVGVVMRQRVAAPLREYLTSRFGSN
ncbi:MAG: M1 family metallopeptidase [Anaerolineales bacterium]